MPRGRPRLFLSDMRQVHLLVPMEHFRVLESMLASERAVNPACSMAELLRSFVAQAVEAYRDGPARQEALEKFNEARRRRIRKLAVACASAPDARLEGHARELARLVEAQ